MLLTITKFHITMYGDISFSVMHACIHTILDGAAIWVWDEEMTKLHNVFNRFTGLENDNFQQVMHWMPSMVSPSEAIGEIRVGLHSVYNNPASSPQRAHTQDAGFDHFTSAETWGETWEEASFELPESWDVEPQVSAEACCLTAVECCDLHLLKIGSYPRTRQSRMKMAPL